MNGRRVKAIRKALARTVMFRGRWVQIGPTRGDLRKAKRTYNRERRGETHATNRREAER